MIPKEMDTLAQNKLILLYLIDGLPNGFNNQELTDFSLENDIMNYFLVKQYLTELIETGLIDQTDQGTYFLKDQGKEALEYFSDNLSKQLQNELSDALFKYHKLLKKDEQTKTTLFQNSLGQHFVTLELLEHNVAIFSLTLQIPNEESGKQISSYWKTQPAEIYQKILLNLTQQDL